jgi:hypothetical protein
VKIFIVKNAPQRMRRKNVAARWLAGLLLIFALTFVGAPAFAQSCAMCYQTVKGAPKDGQRALNRAILVMLAPPLAAMTFGVGWAFRYGKQRDLERENEEREKQSGKTPE